MTATLPTPRALLTTLLNTLITGTLPATQDAVNELYSAPSNPFHALPPSQRALLTTLHVLFPPGMLLQSLDLLDRELITHITQASTWPQESEAVVLPPQAHVHLPPSSEKRSSEEGWKNEVYLVRSSQQTSRFKDSLAAKGQIYTVRLKAWNCSCAAFAFSSFPASASPFQAQYQTNLGTGFEGVGDGGKGWEFGDLSFDGKGEEGGNVPICKHLLACMLVDRWGLVWGGYIKERVVGREEMAGLGAE